LGNFGALNPGGPISVSRNPPQAPTIQ
jgi:hypothetical protein